MGVYASPNVLDSGLAYLKSKCNTVLLVDYAFTAGDSYATVRGIADANIIASCAITPASDTVLSNQGTLGRQATINASTYTSLTAVKTSSGTTGQLKYVAIDTAGAEVLAAWDCLRDPVITLGDPVYFPNLPYLANQPVAV